MNWLFHYQFWIGGLIALTMLRRLMIILAAEQGRKQDLVRKLYKNTQELRVSVLVPFLDAADYSALLSLLRVLAEQNYPTSKVTIHLVASSQTRPALVPQALRYNVRVWECPDDIQNDSQAISWLIDRCLAHGGNSLFVFLRATDMVKPDFFRNLVARSIDSFAIQGYLALKNPPQTLFDKADALTTRLFNRIDNAGRYHLGMSCRLLDSGWAIKQDVLEMIPYKRGMDLDNLEYTLRLNLENFHVTWAPNVVVYAESHTPFLKRITLQASTVGNRLRMLTVYGPHLLTQSAFRFNRHAVAGLAALVRPPAPTLPVALLALAVVVLQRPLLARTELACLALTAAAMALQILAMWVARCRTADFFTLAVAIPLSFATSLLSLPVGLIRLVQGWSAKRREGSGEYRKVRTTRFNEAMAGSAGLNDYGNNADDSQSPRAYGLYDGDEADDLPTVTYGLLEESPAPMAMLHPGLHSGGSPEPAYAEREIIRPLPLSNGKKQVECLLKTQISPNATGQETYRLTLEYKNVAFTTASYRILDQAFYELHAKLVARGLTPVACGSCGYFYNPTADQPGVLKNMGVCLQGKLGKEVNLNADAVSVISPACEHHSPLEQREAFVRAWKESLMGQGREIAASPLQ